MSGTCSHRADSSKRCTSTALVTTQMLTQMRLATVSLCVLCETAGAPGVRTAAAAARHEHALLDEVGVARSRPTQARKAPRRGTKRASALLRSLAAPLSHPHPCTTGRLLPSSATLSKKGHQPWR